MEKIKVGIIGAGRIAKVHIERYQEMKEIVEIVAISDIVKKKAQDLASNYGISKVYTDYKKMLEEDINAVSICLPVYLHSSVSVDAMKAGKHVLCEKPMARNAAEAEKMVETAKREKKKLMVYYRRRFSPEAVKAKEIIDRGELGKIYYAKSVFYRSRGRPGFDWWRDARWFINKKLAGGGVIMDLTGYQIDLILGLLNFPKIKSASCCIYQEIDKEKAKKEGMDIEEFAVGFIRLKDGGCIWLETSMAINLEDFQETVICGSHGGLKISPLTLYKEFSFQPGVLAKIPIKPSAEVTCHNPQYYFIDSIIKNKPIPICSGEEGLIVTKVQDAFYKSAALNKEINF